MLALSRYFITYIYQGNLTFLALTVSPRLLNPLSVVQAFRCSFQEDGGGRVVCFFLGIPKVCMENIHSKAFCPQNVTLYGCVSEMGVVSSYN